MLPYAKVTCPLYIVPKFYLVMKNGGGNDQIYDHLVIKASNYVKDLSPKTLKLLDGARELFYISNNTHGNVVPTRKHNRPFYFASTTSVNKIAIFKHATHIILIQIMT